MTTTLTRNPFQHLLKSATGSAGPLDELWSGGLMHVSRRRDSHFLMLVDRDTGKVDRPRPQLHVGVERDGRVSAPESFRKVDRLEVNDELAERVVDCIKPLDS
jgi:hypothetical protein